MANFDLEISGAHKRTTLGHVDWYYGSGLNAWPSITAAKLAIPSALRAGLTIGVIESGKVVEYIWHPEDITDNGLILKVPDRLDLTQDQLGADLTFPVTVGESNWSQTAISISLDEYTGASDFRTRTYSGIIEGKMTNPPFGSKILRQIGVLGHIDLDLINFSQDDLYNPNKSLGFFIESVLIGGESPSSFNETNLVISGNASHILLKTAGIFINSSALIELSASQRIKMDVTGLYTLELGSSIGNLAIFTDNTDTPAGLQYGADYSTNYTARSLVDKAYVDTTLNTYQLISAKGIANGYAPLDFDVKIPSQYLPDSILGQLVYGGNVDISTAIVATLSTAAKSKLGTALTTITLSNDTAAITGYVANEGIYYITSVAGTFAGITFAVGDWLISNGSTWEKVDNSDAVTSVFGRSGAVTGVLGDYNADQITQTATREFVTPAQKTVINNLGTISTQNNNAVNIDGGNIDGTIIGATTKAAINGTTANFTDLDIPKINNPAIRIVGVQGQSNGVSIINAWGASTNPGVTVGTTRNDGIAFQVRRGVTIDGVTNLANNDGNIVFQVNGDGNSSFLGNLSITQFTPISLNFFNTNDNLATVAVQKFHMGGQEVGSFRLERTQAIGKKSEFIWELNGVERFRIAESGATLNTNLTALNLSGTNTGDQDISGISTNTSAISILQSEQITQNNAIALNTAKITNANHTGDVTGSGALTIANGAVSLLKTSAGVQASLAKADSALQEILSPISGNWFRGYARIGGDGVMEVGNVIDFHTANSATTDFDVRLQAISEGLRILNKDFIVGNNSNANAINLKSTGIITAKTTSVNTINILELYNNDGADDRGFTIELPGTTASGIRFKKNTINPIHFTDSVGNNVFTINNDGSIAGNAASFSSSVTIQANTDNSTQDLLYFDTISGWKLKTINAGPVTKLVLDSILTNKNFTIADQGVDKIVFNSLGSATFASSVQAASYKVGVNTVIDASRNISGGTSLKLSGTDSRIETDTTDNNDTKRILIGGGGQAGLGARGGYMVLHGSDYAGAGGNVTIVAGEAGQIEMFTNGGSAFLLDNTRAATFASSIIAQAISGTTGTFSNNIILTKLSQSEILRNDNTGTQVVSGGNGVSSGGNILLRGGAFGSGENNAVIIRNGNINIASFNNGVITFTGTVNGITKAMVGLSNVPNTDFTNAVALNTAKRSYPTADESKLAGIETGAQVNVPTNLTTTYSSSNVNINSSTGSDIILFSATTSAAGVMTSADKTKLDGIEVGATGDQTNDEIRAAVEAAFDSNVFTNADHSKLNGIQAGAEVNVQSDWNAISGDALILNKPNLPPIDGGEYTPTIVTSSNVDTISSVIEQAFWYKIQDTVYVNITMLLKPTASGTLNLELSLPQGFSDKEHYHIGGHATTVIGLLGRGYVIESLSRARVVFPDNTTNQTSATTITFFYKELAANPNPVGEDPGTPAPVSQVVTDLTLQEPSIGTINLLWTDNATSEDGYTAEWSTNNFATITGSNTSLGPNSTSASVSGLTSGVTYFFRVRPNFTGYTVAWSNTAAFTISELGA